MTGRRILVLGGARSGKSAHAEGLLTGEEAVDYIATARHDPSDREWAERIARHRASRPPSWNTLETTDLAPVLGSYGHAALIDSITTWLSSAMDAAGSWGENPDADALSRALDETVGAWAATTRLVVAVSDEVGSSIVPETASGRLFRDTLGLLNQRLASSADEVWLVTAGIGLKLR